MRSFGRARQSFSYSGMSLALLMNKNSSAVQVRTQMGGGPPHGGPPPGMGGGGMGGGGPPAGGPPRGGMMGAGPPPGMRGGAMGGGPPGMGGGPPPGGPPPGMMNRGAGGGPMGGGGPGGAAPGMGGARGGAIPRMPAAGNHPMSAAGDPRQALEKDPSPPTMMHQQEFRPGRVVEIRKTPSGRVTEDQARAYLQAVKNSASYQKPPFFGMGGTTGDIREFTAAKALGGAAYNLSPYEKEKLEQAPQRSKGVRFLGEKMPYVSNEEQDAKSELPQLPYLFISSKSEHDRLLDDSNAIAWQIIPILAAKPKLPRSVREISTELKVVTRHILSAKYGGLLKYAGSRRHLFNVLRDKNGVPHLILTPAARMELYKRWNQRAGIKEALGVTGHSGTTPYYGKVQAPRTVFEDKKGMAVLDTAVASEEEANATDLV